METPSSTLPARRSGRRNGSRALTPTPAGVASVGNGSGQDAAPQNKSGNRAGVQFGIEQNGIDWRGIDRRGMEQLGIELFTPVEPHGQAAIPRLDNQRVGTAWTSKWTNYLRWRTPSGIRRQASSKPNSPKQTTSSQTKQNTFSQTMPMQTTLGQTPLRRTPLMGSEGGMATAEYAIATLAAVGLAGLLVVILRSEEVRGFLLNLVRIALSLP